jgi:hypothetical protein
MAHYHHIPKVGGKNPSCKGCHDGLDKTPQEEEILLFSLLHKEKNQERHCPT